MKGSRLFFMVLITLLCQDSVSSSLAEETIVKMSEKNQCENDICEASISNSAGRNYGRRLDPRKLQELRATNTFRVYTTDDVDKRVKTITEWQESKITILEGLQKQLKALQEEVDRQKEEINVLRKRPK